MEILSDSSSHKTFESQSLSGTEDIKEHISESIGHSRSTLQTSSFGSNVSTREENFKDPQSVSESESTASSSSRHSSSSGTPVNHGPDTSSISSSKSSDLSYGEETAYPREYFLRRCIRTAHQYSKESQSKVPESSPQKPFEAEFCSSCIKAIKYGNQMKEVKPAKLAETMPLVDPLIIEKLKFENLVHAMKKVTRESKDSDNSQNCTICRNQKSRVDETTFLREKIHHLRKHLTEWKLQQHLVTMDPLNQIGNLASGLPRVSDPPQDVWEKLLKK